MIKLTKDEKKTMKDFGLTAVVEVDGHRVLCSDWKTAMEFVIQFVNK